MYLIRFLYSVEEYDQIHTDDVSFQICLCLKKSFINLFFFVTTWVFQIWGTKHFFILWNVSAVNKEFPSGWWKSSELDSGDIYTTHLSIIWLKMVKMVTFMCLLRQIFNTLANFVVCKLHLNKET